MKNKSIYVCQSCGAQYSKWIGRCNECLAWNTIEEEQGETHDFSFVKSDKKSSRKNKDNSFHNLCVSDSTHSLQRYDSGINEFNRVLGGGMVPGSTILLYGEPGIGKSTLLLQICNIASKHGLNCLYVSGEESVTQIKIRAQRLGIDNSDVRVLIATNISEILEAIPRVENENNTQEHSSEEKKDVSLQKALMMHANQLLDVSLGQEANPQQNGNNEQEELPNIEKINEKSSVKKTNKPLLLIVDSIQTMLIDEINSAPGSVSQVKACTFELTKIAKQKNLVLLVVGHVTKEGQVAGPKLLEHMVDTVLLFEGDGTRQYRIVRAIKNRYGSTNEIGVFAMSNEGLIEVENPSSIFMSSEANVSGSCIFAGYEGSRSILLEVQALVAPSFIPSPRRSAVGWDNNRLSMIIATLGTRLGIKIMDKEIYLNIAGGLKVEEPAIDLAVAVSLISATCRLLLPRDVVFFGEVGLLGELRQVNQSDVRINQAVKLGFKKIVMPYDAKFQNKSSANIVQLKNIEDLLKFLRKYGTYVRHIEKENI